MAHIIEEYGMLIVEALGGSVAIGVIAGAIHLLVKNGHTLLSLVF